MSAFPNHSRLLTATFSNPSRTWRPGLPLLALYGIVLALVNGRRRWRHYSVKFPEGQGIPGRVADWVGATLTIGRRAGVYQSANRNPGGAAPRPDSLVGDSKSRGLRPRTLAPGIVEWANGGRFCRRPTSFRTELTHRSCLEAMKRFRNRRAILNFVPVLLLS